ncbi:hypothetical protein HC752_09260 [Vibrio sp. S9_S30]|uniref:M12 family metallopeptidase n=1 Tax=Vibrio sp. S9_S30 TaxID=2720226 RepID=UPI0016812BDD|nr:M12 family metallopeptidase [Vibrio sp. S9_S30]MBD1557127.1 hypothetical protein [Vibrio sp. S9_S30]
MKFNVVIPISVLAMTPLIAFGENEVEINAEIPTIDTQQTHIIGTNDFVTYDVKALEGGDTAVFQGDIILGPAEEVQNYGIPPMELVDENDRRGRSAWSGFEKWPNGVVPYTISSSLPAKDVAGIKEAMRSIESVSKVRFVERTNQKHYVRIIRDKGCYSKIGYERRVQPLSIGKGCGKPGIVAHELLHTLGFFHTHQRADRDKYVTINWGNIRQGMEFNFQKRGSVSTSAGPYDVRSIMHYRAWEFGDGRVTISSKDPSVPNNQIGQRQSLTKHDISALQKMYGANDATTKTYNLDPISKIATKVSVKKSGWQQYVQELSSGYKTLTITTSGGTGDVDLYVRKGTLPNRSSYDCRSRHNGSAESCVINSPAEGKWYIGLYGHRASSGVTVTVKTE